MATIKQKAVLAAVRAAVSSARASIAATHAKASKPGISKKSVASYRARAARAQGKAYEVRILLGVLRKMDRGGYTLSCTPKSGVLTFGGSPCKPDPLKYDWIDAKKDDEKLQVWISLQFRTLSYSLKPLHAPVDLAHLHEIDVGVYRVLTGSSYPTLDQVVFAASCKFGGWSKAYVRDALGLRRELGFLSPPCPSRAPWYGPAVRAEPAIPLLLCSSNALCRAYRSVRRLGLYIHCVS